MDFPTKKLVLVLLVSLVVILSLGSLVTACDTFVALGNATADGSVIFVKSSNRNNEENMYMASYPRQTHEPGEMVQCSWISIPQVAVTYAVKGGQPWWGFGFEQGMNEYGVCAGNEALGTKMAVRKDMLDTSLTGMDLLRLGLERGKTAYEAMHVVIDLLEEYGQFGRTSADPKATGNYHNSYMFADPNEAWILETAGYEWIAKKVVDVATIDNVCAIEDEWDEISPNMIQTAIDNGWYDPGEPFNFALHYGLENFSEIKFLRVTDMLQQKKGQIDLEFMMSVARDRLEGTWMESRYAPSHFYRHIDGCTETSSTAGVMVAHLRKDLPQEIAHTWWVAQASPTTSVFSPHWFVADNPEELASGDDYYDPDVAWWKFDLLDRMSRENYHVFTPIIRSVWAQEEETLLVQTRMIEREVMRLLADDRPDEVAPLLTAYERANMDRQLDIADSLAEALRVLHKTIPGPLKKVMDNESSNIRAGIVLWPDEE